MSEGVALLFWSLALFQAKHFICDYVLQTTYQYTHKGIYGHPGGVMHAGIHIVGTVPALLLLTSSLPLIGAILGGEFLVHYHMDWLKEQINKRRALRIEQHLYWIVFGADQLVHQMTYVVILAVLARAANL